MKAIGHGISESFLDKVREVATQFFALPGEEKLKYDRLLMKQKGMEVTGLSLKNKFLIGLSACL